MFLFIGGNLRDTFSSSLLSLKEKNGLDNVHFTGTLPNNEIPYYESLADLIVYPDIINNPGFPTVLAESMAMGKPIIVGARGYEDATPIKDFINGRIISPGNTKELLETIIELRDDSNQRERYGNSVRKYTEEYMDWSKVAGKYRKILEEACV
jgi:hypothetical protein